MKILKEEYKNFPTEGATTVLTPSEAQSVKDEKEFDKRKSATEKEIQVKLPVDGAPSAEKPKQEVFPKSALKEALEDTDGWDNEETCIEDLINVLNTSDVLEYEIKNCRRGVKTNCTTYGELAKLVRTLAGRFNDVADELEQEAENEGIVEESLAESINETDAARIVLETIKHNFGVDVDVATYKDTDNSKSVIVEFVASKEDCKKMPYDELKAALYKRFGNDINISSKQFSSPNLKNKGTEYKLKLFVLKEKKDKSKIYAEDLDQNNAQLIKSQKPAPYTWTDNGDNTYTYSNGSNIYGLITVTPGENLNDPEVASKPKNKVKRTIADAEIFDTDVNPTSNVRSAKKAETPNAKRPLLDDVKAWIEKNLKTYTSARTNIVPRVSLYTRVYNELNKQSDFGKELQTREFGLPNAQRYSDVWDDKEKQSIFFDVNDIIVYGPTREYLAFAKQVADHYGFKDTEIEANPRSKDPSQQYKIVFEFTDDQLPTDDEEDLFDIKYKDNSSDDDEE